MPSAPIHPSRYPTRLGRCGRAGVMLALLALLLAQGVGLAHRVWHDPTHRPGADLAHPRAHHDCAHDDTTLPSASGHAVAHIDDLFDDHPEGSAECRLMDQLAHADALLGGVSLAWADVAPSVPDRVAPCPAAGRSNPPYQARAPPLQADPTPAAHAG